jgi:type I restriction enzyme S subunit
MFIRDGTHGTHKRLNEGIPLLSAKNISRDGHINCDSSDSLISEVDYQKIHSKYFIEENDLLLTVVGTLGRTALVPRGFRKFTLQRSVAIIRLDSRAVHPELCYQYLTGDEFQRQLSLRSNSTAQAGVYLGELGRISIPLPPLPEQKKIASILTSVDEVIENTQKQIDKLQDLKKATMNELLTKGIGHTEFKDSELGRIPKSWEVKRLGDVCPLIRDGTHLPPKRTPYGIPLLSVRNMIGGQFKLLDDDTFVSHEFYERMHAKWRPESGDLLIAVVGATIGKVCQVPKSFPNFTLQRSVGVIRTNSQILLKDYLFYYSQTSLFSKELWDRVNQTAQPGIYLNEIGLIKIPIPSLPEQQKAVVVLTSLQKSLESKKTKLSQTHALKKSLMQDLLTGKKRVQVN